MQAAKSNGKGEEQVLRLSLSGTDDVLADLQLGKFSVRVVNRSHSNVLSFAHEAELGLLLWSVHHQSDC